MGMPARGERMEHRVLHSACCSSVRFLEEKPRARGLDLMRKLREARTPAGEDIWGRGGEGEREQGRGGENGGKEGLFKKQIV